LAKINKNEQMKKIVFAAMVLGLSSMALTTKAQDDDDSNGKSKNKSKKESQEIIIRQNGDKKSKIVVEINGDNVIINGKPLADFKDDNVTINRRNITVWDGKGNKSFEFSPDEFLKGMTWSSDDNSTPHAFLGVTTDETDNDGGAKIVDVTKESAAEKAGLKKGDIITKVDDKKVGSPDELTDVIGAMKPKAEVKVYYKRDGKESSTTATLGEHKSMSMSYSFSGPGSAKAFSIPRTPGAASGGNFNWDGMDNMNNLKNMPKVYGMDGADVNGYFSFPRRQKLGLKIQDTEDGTGVKVLDVDKDSPAEKAGLKKDDIVTSIGGEKITNTDEAREQLQENAEKSTYTIKAKRNGSEMSFDIKIPKKLNTTNL
jgi:serine protease Do